MTFREILAKVVEGTPGARAAVIMGSDGIPVEEYPAEEEALNLPAVAVEFQRVLEESRKVASLLGPEVGGALEEMVLQTSTRQLLFRPIDAEYHLVVELDRSGFLGKARWLVGSLLHEIRGGL